jgi:hypothetical protein
MGVNLDIELEDWDEFANGGMKQIFRDQKAFPKIWRSDDFYDAAFRPADFELWRQSIVALNCNVEMWMRGLAALESNSDLWILASY